MATGVFNTARTGHNMRSRKRRGRPQPLDRFAENLADTDSITRASSLTGVSTTSGYLMFRRICDQLDVPYSRRGDEQLERHS